MDRPFPRKLQRRLALQILGILAVLALAAGVAFYFRARSVEIEQAKKDLIASGPVADQFFADVKAGRLNDAYKLTTPAFRERTSREEFEALAGQYRAAAEKPPEEKGGYQVNGHAVALHHARAVRSDNGSQVRFRLSLVKTGDRFLVDQFTVEEDRRPDTPRAE
jgi:Tfp pilus assembly protein PilE